MHRSTTKSVYARLLAVPDWRRLVVILAGGVIGVVGTSVLVPRQSANATTTAASRPTPGSVVQFDRRAANSSPSAAPSPSPSSTVPTTIPTPAPAPTPTHTAAPSTPAPPAPAPAQPTAARGILPPQNPSGNIAPQPNFLNSCSGSAYDDSSGCVNATLQAIANARQAEGLGPMSLPGNWYGLTPIEQVYVATNLEREARGMQPMSGMVGELDQAAGNGAASNADPEPPEGFGYVQWGSNWAGAVGNPLEAMYFWMYDDGPGSSNIDCTSGNSSGCWGHRDNVLLPVSGSNLYMGAGYISNAYQGSPSWTELLVKATSSWSVDFS